METHRTIEILELHMGDRPDFDDAGVVNKDVDFAEILQRLLDCRLNLRRLEQIALDRQNISRETVQLGFRARELLRVTRDESDFSTACANLACDFQAETA